MKFLVVEPSGSSFILYESNGIEKKTLAQSLDHQKILHRAQQILDNAIADPYDGLICHPCPETLAKKGSAQPETRRWIFF
ncbi:MAG: hypothetical protein NTW50_04490 [Candidatus Berkelbacteria bacterium]|nr:hypothetical protein [Candidatus Berkelbacteria bacterium]